ncbi:MAG TPA: hypothetical protein VJ927_06075 [Actinomycetota bacterium]|nr:hypothetical protein [Actinomycetota bacterium]
MTRACPLVAVLAGLLIGGCGGSSGEEPPRCELPQEVEDLSDLPRDLPVDRWGNVTEIGVENGFLGVVAVTDTTIIELYPQIARAVSEGGYTILSGDNEGFEAEIFFERGQGTTGAFRLRQGPCVEQVTIRLLLEAERYRRQT